ncbi:ZIP family metal transporter [Desulfobacterota bacterium AH_259_B03_O07]|nr:ZIP family metal transporter [Desulfobacterota bacterium AH_259_B03_O07]
MDIIHFKIIMVVVIIVVGLSGGLLPLRFALSEKNRLFFSVGNSFAGGVFLGAGLLHMLPDGLELLGGISEYPLAFLLAGLSLAVLLFLEKVVFIQHELHDLDKVESSPSIYPYLLALVLSIHSFIAGVALGIETTLLATVVIFIAIIAHKGAASFALGISMRKADFIKSLHFKVITLFTIMTPAGIILGSVLSNIFSNTISKELEGIFDSLAAGTFLYVAVLDIIEEEFSIPGNEWLKFVSIIVGFLLMALLAVWS